MDPFSSRCRSVACLTKVKDLSFSELKMFNFFYILSPTRDLYEVALQRLNLNCCQILHYGYVTSGTDFLLLWGQVQVWLLRVCHEQEVQLADARALRTHATQVQLSALQQTGVVATTHKLCCGSVYSIYGSGSSTLTIYRSGSVSRIANTIRIQLDPDPNAGFFVTFKSFSTDFFEISLFF